MKWLAVLYDDHCGICSQMRRWLEKQPSYVPLRLTPLGSANITRMFPGVEEFHPDEKLVVIADDGSLWRGDSAWITLLWALPSGRELAYRLTSPALRPLARRVVTAVSANRIRLSNWLSLTPDSLPDSKLCRPNAGNCAVSGRKG